VPLSVVAGALLAAAWYGRLLLIRDAGLTTFGYDQAFFQQLVWNLGHGRGLVSSWSEESFFALHFEPLLALPAVIELAWPDPRVLSLLAAASLIGMVVGAYLFISALTGRRMVAAALALPLPLWPAVQESTRANFHPETIGIGAALLAGWAALRGRPILCWALAVVALCAKEDQGWNLLAIGLAVATVPESRRRGRRLAGLGVASGLVVVGVVMPLVRGGRPVDTDVYYGWLASASPSAVLHALSQPTGWLAVLVMLTCCGGLPLLRPAWLTLAVPPLVADLLSAHPPQPLLVLQYALPLLVPLLVAAAVAAKDVARPRLAAGLAVPPVLLGLLLGSMPPAPGNPDPGAFSRPPALERLQACASSIPAAAAIAADDPLTVRLASRPSIRELSKAEPGDYVVSDRQALLPSYVDRTGRGQVLSDTARRVVCDDGRFLVLAPATPSAS
jgi:uncharacterized membrane protein